MNCVQDSFICQPLTINKTGAGVVCVLTAAAVVLFIIGLIAQKGSPLSGISQLGRTTNGILLGTSLFLLILDLVWLGILFKKRDDPIIPYNPELEKVNALRAELSALAFSKPLIDLTMSYLLDEYHLEQDEAFNTEAFWNSVNLNNFSYLTVLDERVWAKFPDMGLTFGDCGPVNKRACVSMMRKLRPLIEDDAGMTLLTIPEGLTFNKFRMVEFAMMAQHGRFFGSVWNAFERNFGQQKVANTYRILITNNILLDTRYEGFYAQSEFISRVSMSCRLPRAFEMSALLILTLINSKKRLFQDLYSRSYEDLAVGFFKVDGYNIISHPSQGQLGAAASVYF